MTIADQATAAQLLAAYGIHAPLRREPSKRRAGPARGGIALRIDDADDPCFGRSVQLTIGPRRSSGPSPMNEFRFREDMTPVHLLVKRAHLYDEARLTGLHLRCHLTRRDYRVDDVQIAGGVRVGA